MHHIPYFITHLLQHHRYVWGTCKGRNEIETKRNEIKRNETMLHFVSFRFIRFRFVLFDFVSISFRTLQEPSFDSGLSKNEILELIVFN